jgi:hypothetical protein
MERQFNEDKKRWKDNMFGEYERVEALRKREKESMEEQIKSV